MRRSLVVAVAVLSVAACSKQETPAADSPAMAAAPATPAPLTSADLAGTWDGQSMPMDRDTVLLTFTMTNTPTGEGSTMTFPGGQPIPVRMVSIAGDSAISEAGPFKSQMRSGQNVSVRSVFRLRDGKITGVTRSTYANGDSAMFRVTATKRP